VVHAQTSDGLAAKGSHPPTTLLWSAASHVPGGGVGWLGAQVLHRLRSLSGQRALLRGGLFGTERAGAHSHVWHVLVGQRQRMND
jgi:hypothetical protein